MHLQGYQKPHLKNVLLNEVEKRPLKSRVIKKAQQQLNTERFKTMFYLLNKATAALLIALIPVGIATL